MLYIMHLHTINFWGGPKPQSCETKWRWYNVCEIVEPATVADAAAADAAAAASDSNA